MKHAVLGLLLAGTAAFSAQSPVALSGVNLETPLLIVWGLGLLAVGQRLRLTGKQEASAATPTAPLAATTARAGAHA